VSGAGERVVRREQASSTEGTRKRDRRECELDGNRAKVAA